VRIDGCTPSAPASGDLRLSDGTHVVLRPLHREDGEGLLQLFNRLSAQSRLQRYLSPKPRLSPAELSFLTDVDGITHAAVVAIDERDGSIIGVSRYVQSSECPRIGDLAAEVADEFQGKGVGTALAELTLGTARENGFTALTATTAWDNRAARALLKRLGFHARAARGAELELERRFGV
jgi:acetyltransferase